MLSTMKDTVLRQPRSRQSRLFSLVPILVNMRTENEEADGSVSVCAALYQHDTVYFSPSHGSSGTRSRQSLYTASIFGNILIERQVLRHWTPTPGDQTLLCLSRFTYTARGVSRERRVFFIGWRWMLLTGARGHPRKEHHVAVSCSQ